MLIKHYETTTEFNQGQLVVRLLHREVNRKTQSFRHLKIRSFVVFYHWQNNLEMLSYCYYDRLRVLLDVPSF